MEAEKKKKKEKNKMKSFLGMGKNKSSCADKNEKISFISFSFIVAREAKLAWALATKKHQIMNGTFSINYFTGFGAETSIFAYHPLHYARGQRDNK
jgi:hypothetical protein